MLRGPEGSRRGTEGSILRERGPELRQVAAAGVRKMTSEKPTHTIWVVRGRDPLPQLHEKTSPREKKRTQTERERGKKRDMLNPSPVGPTFSGFGPLLSPLTV